MARTDLSTRAAWLMCMICARCLLLVAWLPTAQGQSLASEPQTRKVEDTVSVQELLVSGKARHAVLLGVEYLRKGDAAQSLTYFKRAIQESPGYPQAYYHKGLAEIQLVQLHEASESFQKAISLTGGRYALAYLGYAQALVLLGRLKDAEVFSRRGLQEDSHLSEGYTVLSITLIKEHRLAEAEEVAQNGLQLSDPFAWKALLPLAYIHQARREYEPAAQDLESYLEHLRTEGNKKLVQQVEEMLDDLKARLSARESTLSAAQSPESW